MFIMANDFILVKVLIPSAMSVNATIIFDLFIKLGQRALRLYAAHQR